MGSFSKVKLQMIVEKDCTYDQISKPQDIVDMINKYEALECSPMEKAIAIGLNTKNEVICYYYVAIGNVNSCNIDVKNIVTPLLLCNASKLILVHNHPSGHAKSSNQDFVVSTGVKAACDLLGIEFLDHLAIATDGYCRCV